MVVVHWYCRGGVEGHGCLGMPVCDLTFNFAGTVYSSNDPARRSRGKAHRIGQVDPDKTQGNPRSSYSPCMSFVAVRRSSRTTQRGQGEASGVHTNGFAAKAENTQQDGYESEDDTIPESPLNEKILWKQLLNGSVGAHVFVESVPEPSAELNRLLDSDRPNTRHMVLVHCCDRKGNMDVIEC